MAAMATYKPKPTRFKRLEKPKRANLDTRNRAVLSTVEVTRKAKKSLYSSKQWQQLRLAQLQQQPLCSFCKQRGITEPATVVDHVAPHQGDKALFFNPYNLQSLCKPCHDSDKARLETMYHRGEIKKYKLRFAPELGG